MKTFRLLTTLATIAGAITLSSCFPRTGEDKPPALRPLPQFNDGLVGSAADPTGAGLSGADLSVVDPAK